MILFCVWHSVWPISSSSKRVVITHVGVMTVLQHCRELLSLDVHDCLSGVDPRVDEDVLAEGVEAMLVSRLMPLNLNSCKLLNERCLFLFSRLSSSLREFYLHSCLLLSDNGVLSIARHCSNLRTLSLFHCVLLTA